MSKKLLLKKLENLDESLQDKLLSEFIKGIDFETSIESLSQVAVDEKETAEEMPTESKDY